MDGPSPASGSGTTGNRIATGAAAPPVAAPDGERDADPSNAAAVGAVAPITQGTSTGTTADAPRTHPPDLPLPRPLTALVGRARLVAEVRVHLASRAVRLVTLVGPGGVGKSRVALAAADGAAALFPNGVRFVELAAVRDAALVMPVVAAALHLRVPDGDAERALRSHLRDRRLLLVLDNMEQVIDAGPALADLLRACPGISALVTSRRRLGLRGERLVAVDPLPVPDPDDAPDRIAASPAVALFLLRAAEAGAPSDPDAATTAAVADVCRRLDGLPLAIELAAAQAAVLPPAALASRLATRLPALAEGPRDAPARLRTVRDAIAWSHDLLAPAERTRFAALAVCVGGFGPALAAAVAGDERDDEAGDALAALVDHHLVRREQPSGAAGSRFGMLETVREFALERLAASGEEAAARARHAAWCADLAERAWPALAGWVDQERWLARLDAETANLRAALAWALDHDPALALRIAGAVFWYWYLRGRLGEGRAWLRAVLAADPGNDGAATARALLGAGVLAHWQGDDEEAFATLRRSIAAWRTAGDDGVGLRSALCLLGVFSVDHGAYRDAVPLLEEGIARCRTAGDRGTAAHALAHLGFARWGLGDATGAEAALETSLSEHTTRADAVGRALALFGLTLLAAHAGDRSLAERRQRESAAVAGTLGAAEGTAQVIANGAVVADMVGRHADAVRLLGAASALRDRLGTRPWLPERLPWEHAEAAARAALGAAEFAAAWDEGTALDHVAAIALADPPDPAAQTSPTEPGRLTAREREVLRLVAAGRTNAEIGEALFISHGTARIHVSNILAKLGARTRAEAAAVARQRHLV